LKTLLLTHENESVANEHSGNLKGNPNIIIAAYERLNEAQKNAFIADSKFDLFSRARINII
jgi:hypothetical protein